MQIYTCTILAVLISVNGFSQTTRKKVTRKEFLHTAVSLDTVTTTNYYPDSTIKEINTYYNSKNTAFNTNSVYQFYIKTEKYWPNGIVKQESIFDNGLAIKSILYNKQGQKSVEEIFEYKNPDDCIFTLDNQGILSKNLNTFTQLTYSHGKMYTKKYYKNNKRHGVWSFYDHKTGMLEKTITYNEGKKQK